MSEDSSLEDYSDRLSSKEEAVSLLFLSPQAVKESNKDSAKIVDIVLFMFVPPAFLYSDI